MKRWNYEKAVDVLMPVYMFHIAGTCTEQELESILIAALVRKGISKVQARKYVLKFLDEE